MSACVGIVVAEHWAEGLSVWRCMIERCVTIRLRIEGVRMTIVQVYAPTDDKDEKTKSVFYGELQVVRNW